MTESTRINFADVDDQKEFSVLPAGKYVADISAFSEKEASSESKNPGARLLRWEFTVSEGQEYENRKVWDNQVCVSSTMWKIKALFAAAGLDTQKISFDSEDKEFFLGEDLIDMDDLVGTRLTIGIGIRPGNKDPKTGNEYKAQNRVNNFFEYEATEGDLLP